MTTLTMNNIIYLDPSVLVPHPQNPRPKSAFKKTNPKMQELIKSISEVDVIQPITVRVLDKKTHQVVAGHRRYYAAKYAEKQIPALVRELDDASALALMLAENIQREDADPIMESRTIALLIDENNSLETVAARFGKSYSWAYKRAQLGKLSAKWIDAQTNGEINWSIDLLVVIARYATETQDALYDILIGHRYEDAYTIETLTQALAKFHHDISKTPWEAADADLLPEAGACSACTKRASCQQTLFDEMTIKKKGPDYCTDHLCWKKKSGLFVERKMIALKEKHGVEITKVSVDSYRPEDESIKGYQDYVKVKKTDPKARLAIVTDGPQEGATIWINDRHSYQSTKITAAKAARDLGKEPSQKALKEELGEKREALTKRRVLDAWHNLLRVLVTSSQR